MVRTLFLAGFAGAAVLTLSAIARADKLDDFVNSQLPARHAPGVAVGIVRDGKLVTARGYGLANVENHVPVTPDTVFEIGSMTKQFTAALVLMQVEEGKIGLDDKIDKYLPDTPAAWREITVRNLLTHTSGIKGYTEVAPSFLALAREPHTQQEIVKMVSGLPLAFAPGQKWAYSNTGYYLLGMILEKVAGKPYMELLGERILKPLAMTNTRDGAPEAIIRNRASGYLWDGKLQNAPWLQPTAAFAAGCLVSTVGDLAKWDAALATDRLLKPSSRDMMWTPVKLKGGGEFGYGFGWAIGSAGGHKLIEHGGGTAGFSTDIARYPGEKITVIVLTNCQAGAAEQIARGVAALQPELKPAPVKPAEDRDLALTAKHRALAESAADAKMDPSLFTDAARKVIFPDHAAQAAQALKALGKMKSFSLKSDEKQGQSRIRRYRAEYDGVTVLYTIIVSEDGKVAGMNIGQDAD
ncbi:MAG TPA: serine hydrolase domain-containing protein [Chthonomonadaceae bacterium]|nr:serine hydrolase domain-containing protein [Chthonomonadaceae bacterium]